MKKLRTRRASSAAAKRANGTTAAAEGPSDESDPQLVETYANGAATPKMGAARTFGKLLEKMEESALGGVEDLRSATIFSDHIIKGDIAVVRAAWEAMQPYLTSGDGLKVYLVVGLLDYCTSRATQAVLEHVGTVGCVEVLERVARQFDGEKITQRIFYLFRQWDETVTYSGLFACPTPLQLAADRLEEDFPEVGDDDGDGDLSKTVQFKGKCGKCGVKLLFPPNALQAKCGRCNSLVKLPSKFKKAVAEAGGGRGKSKRAASKGFSVEKLAGLKQQNDELREQVMQKRDLEAEMEKLRLENARLKAAQEEQAEENLCSICLDNKKDSALVPCGHLFCYSCARHMKKKGSKQCGICRMEIKYVNKLFGLEE